ncbi:MAG: hypothetical protein CL678_12000 [Bdellovibrionaceae bacterium]|nr:hypothetical protein [Pseudobdellovibrionaceae bacterium]|tara:strand:+ start:2278 stop:3333 length:1056 start_codon:yes stop_codon:yes gene_type:complete
MKDTSVESILVRAPNWIGDQVLAYPFYRFLRQAYPKAKITVASVPWMSDLHFLKEIDEIHILKKSQSNQFLKKWFHLNQLALDLRKKGPFDLGVSLPNSFSAGWLLYRSGAKRRVGYRVDGRSFLLNEGVHWDDRPNRHRSQAYVDLLKLNDSRAHHVVDFWKNESDPVFDVEGQWNPKDTLEPPDEPFWVLAPGATASSRRWPLERFVEFAQKVKQDTGWKGIIVGGPSEVELGIQLSEYPGVNLLDWTSRCSITGLWKVFRESQFFLGNESGLAHVASLCGARVQIVCGAADPRRTKALGPGPVDVKVNPVDCWPCERNVCTQKGIREIQCLKGIHSNHLWKELREDLK